MQPKEEEKKEDDDNNNDNDDEESDSDDSWNDPDPIFQQIYEMLQKPSKLMRKATLIHDKIYLGGRKEILDVVQLKEIQITHIVHCAEDPPNKELNHEHWLKFFGNQFNYFGFVSEDERKYDMIGIHWK
eukprot:59205_1